MKNTIPIVPSGLVICMVLAAILVAGGDLLAAEWQYAVETGVKSGQAFMWIPPDCNKVRGIIIGQQVILENTFLEDPQIRAAAARGGLAEVLIVPFALGDFDEKGGSAEILQQILDKLAEVSGYPEVASAPLLPIGHSGGGIPAWNLAYWNPSRTIALVTVKCAVIHAPFYSPKATIDGVPVLAVSGQYESWGDPNRSAEHHWRWLRGSLLECRAVGRSSLVSELVEPGVTHFGWSKELASYISLFIDKAVKYRVPVNAGGAASHELLRKIPMESGWLTDCTFMTPSRYAPAPYARFKGDPTLALWQLDEDIAWANENYGKKHKGKKLQVVTFSQDGKLLASAWIQKLRFEPMDDGMIVKVMADFAKETPPEMSFPKRQLGHAKGPIKFSLIGGWNGGGRQIGSGTFRIETGRMGFVRPFGNIIVLAWHPGDRNYSYAEQAAQIEFPVRNTIGKPQQITFPVIPDQPSGERESKLSAQSDSGLPVSYCVMYGPAEVRGDILILTRPPANARYPIKVSVMAYQWGRSIPPLYQTAEPVERTFLVKRFE
jgi:hypothetical protein